MNETTVENENGRDYDKDPIVIKDRMPEISFLVIAIFFLIAIIFVFLFVPIKEDLNWEYTIGYVTIMYGGLFVFLKSKIKKNRTIIFHNQYIERIWDENVLKIEIMNIKNVKKSFLDFYDSKQKVLSFYKPIYYLLFPVTLLFHHPILIFLKFMYKLLYKFSNTSIFDTVVFFDKNDEMITVFIESIEDKERINEYLKNIGYEEMVKLHIFYTNMYSPDEITHYFNKKD